MFIAMFRRPFDFEKWVNKLSEKQLLILENIHKNNEIKKSTLRVIIGFSAKQG